jgi:hypothetical protein
MTGGSIWRGWREKESCKVLVSGTKQSFHPHETRVTL